MIKKLISLSLSLTILLSLNGSSETNKFKNLIKNLELDFPSDPGYLNLLINHHKNNFYDDIYLELYPIHEMVASIKKNTEKYIKENNDTYLISFFDISSELYLSTLIFENFYNYLKSEDNVVNLNNLIIVFKPLDGANGTYSKDKNLICLNLEFLRHDKVDYIYSNTLVHELIHCFQNDIINYSFFPNFLTEASATSYGNYYMNDMNLVYSNERLFEKLFILTGYCNGNNILDYYDALFNNDFFKFTEFLNYNTQEEKQLITLLSELEFIIMTYDIKQVEEEYLSLELETKLSYVGHDSLQWLYDKALSNLLTSSYTIEEKIFLSEVLNNTLYTIFEQNINQTLINDISNSYRKFINQLISYYGTDIDNIKDIILIEQKNIQEAYYYNYTKDEITYSEGYQIYLKYDIFNITPSTHGAPMSETYHKLFTLK